MAVRRVTATEVNVTVPVDVVRELATNGGNGPARFTIHHESNFLPAFEGLRFRTLINKKHLCVA